MITLRDYQLKAASWTVNAIVSKPHGAMLNIDMGLGKTLTMLWAIDLLNTLYGINNVLVSAPAKVTHHWVNEAKSLNIKATAIEGTPEKRRKLITKPGIKIISHDLLSRYNDLPPVQLFVVDESSLLRNWSAQRTKAARRIAAKTPIRILLTGRPMPNGDRTELFAQIWLIDHGKALGSNITRFREKFCYRGGFENREWIFDEAQSEVFDALVAPYILRMEDSDYLRMPSVISNPVDVVLPKDVLAQYKQLEQELYVALTDTEVYAESGASKYNLCRQIASGGLYIDSANRDLHTAKIEKLIELQELTSGNLLVAYEFTREYEQICRFLKRKLPVINGDTSTKETNRIINAWADNKIPMLLAQSRAISHGVDGLQHGGNNLVFFSQTNSNDARQQLIGRLRRSGQTKPVVVHELLAVGTLDKFIKRTTEKKDVSQKELLDFLKLRVQL